MQTQERTLKLVDTTKQKERKKNCIQITDKINLDYIIDYVADVKTGREWKVLLKVDGRQYTLTYTSYGQRQPHIISILIYLEDSIRNHYATELSKTKRSKTTSMVIENSYRVARERQRKITLNMERLFGKYFLDYFDLMKRIRKTL